MVWSALAVFLHRKSDCRMVPVVSSVLRFKLFLSACPLKGVHEGLV